MSASLRICKLSGRRFDPWVVGAGDVIVVLHHCIKAETGTRLKWRGEGGEIPCVGGMAGGIAGGVIDCAVCPRQIGLENRRLIRFGVKFFRDEFPAVKSKVVGGLDGDFDIGGGSTFDHAAGIGDDDGGEGVGDHFDGERSTDTVLKAVGVAHGETRLKCFGRRKGEECHIRLNELSGSGEGYFLILVLVEEAEFRFTIGIGEERLGGGDAKRDRGAFDSAGGLREEIGDHRGSGLGRITHVLDVGGRRDRGGELGDDRSRGKGYRERRLLGVVAGFEFEGE